MNSDVISKAIKSALEANGIKSIPGVDMDDLIKSITDSVLKSVDIKELGGSLLNGLSKNILGK